MELIDTRKSLDQNSNLEPIAVLALSKEEALQIIHDLVNQVSDAPGAGSRALILTSTNKSIPGRIGFLVRS